MTQVITLRPIEHRKQQHIAIGFAYNEALKAYVMAFEGVRWSATHKSFYVPNDKGVLHQLFNYLQKGGYYVDYKTMRYKPQQTKPNSKVKPPGKVLLYKSLTSEGQKVLTGYVSYLRGKRLSESTVSTYGYFILRFLYHTRDLVLNTLQTNDINRFMEGVIAKEHYSISSHRQCVSAFKHFTEFCNITGFDASNFERPKKSKYLPTVLSKQSIIHLMQATKNLKHRTIIGLLYSGGLRIGELLQLELKDLDFDRSQILIRQGKGRKDRLVGMSQVIKPLLFNYIQTYNPNHYVIEGRDGLAYSPNSVRQFLKESCRLAGITKPVTPHTLRHSYATHMLENGVDLRFIQELLGHAKPETTMIYTHVAQKDLAQIQNPLDVAVEGFKQSVNGGKKVFISGTGTD